MSGGHGHLEQPLTAMSWEEPCVRQFILECSCTCSAVAACHHNRDWSKFWLFASTLKSLSAIACKCDHPPGTHQEWAGKTDAHGNFLSRLTAEYPESLCQAIAECIHHQVSHSPHAFLLSHTSAQTTFCATGWWRFPISSRLEHHSPQQ